MRIDINRGLSKKILQKSIKQFLEPVDTAFHIHTTLGELVAIVREREIKHEVNYFYAIDDNNRLHGFLSLHDVLFNSPETRLIEIVDEEIITLHQNVSVEHAINVLSDHQYLSMPIVDDEYCLVGLFEIKPTGINFSRRFKKRPNKEIQQIFQIIGFTIEKNKFSSKWVEYCYRMPWLVGNLIAGFICAAIASYFHATLQQAVVVSMFIPLILTLAESISMQSMTISLQFLSYKKLHSKEIIARIIHEWSVAIFLGCSSALLLMVYYLLGYSVGWHPDTTVIAIATSIIVSMVVAASFGTLFPLVLHRFSLDPKVAAGPVVLMMTDVTAMTVYLALTTWMLF